jgi:hypothetical protein
VSGLLVSGEGAGCLIVFVADRACVGLSIGLMVDEVVLKGAFPDETLVAAKKWRIFFVIFRKSSFLCSKIQKSKL